MRPFIRKKFWYVRVFFQNISHIVEKKFQFFQKSFKLRFIEQCNNLYKYLYSFQLFTPTFGFPSAILNLVISITLFRISHQILLVHTPNLQLYSTANPIYLIANLILTYIYQTILAKALHYQFSTCLQTRLIILRDKLILSELQESDVFSLKNFLVSKPVYQNRYSRCYTIL